MANWYFYENGRKVGPISAERLKGLAEAGHITPETIVENETGKQARASKVKGLVFPQQGSSNFVSAPPIITPNSESDNTIKRWIDAKTDEEVKQWKKADTDESHEFEGVEKIVNLQKQLSVCINNLPYSKAFKRAMIAIRAIIKGKIKAGIKINDLKEDILLLYKIAAIDSFLGYDTDICESDVIEMVPGAILWNANIDYYQIGFVKVRLINKMDSKWLMEIFGEPTQHTTLNFVMRELWDKYLLKIKAIQEKYEQYVKQYEKQYSEQFMGYRQIVEAEQFDEEGINSINIISMHDMIGWDEFLMKQDWLE